MNIAVAGTGYVGMSIATLLAQHNHVTAVDVIPEKVEKINNKISPIQDDYIEKYLAEKELDLTATLDGASAYKAAEKSSNATIFVNRDYDPKQYGIVVQGGKGDTPEIAGMSDKMNYYSITGLYVFPNSVLKHIFEIEKSERQRYEITSVSQIFNQQNKLRIQKLSSDCIWFDTNTFDGIMNSSLHIQKLC